MPVFLLNSYPFIKKLIKHQHINASILCLFLTKTVENFIDIDEIQNFEHKMRESFS